MSWPDDLFLSFNLSSAQLMDPATSFNILAILNRVGLRPASAGARNHRDGDDDRSRDRAEDRQRTARGRHRAFRSTISAPASRASAGCATSPSTRSRSTAPSSREITTDRPSEHIIKAILAMCEGLDLKVIAEGIEELGAGREASRARLPKRPGLSLRQADECGKGLRTDHEEPRHGRRSTPTRSARAAPEADQAVVAATGVPRRSASRAPAPRGRRACGFSAR